jgi:hypothetical protein
MEIVAHKQEAVGDLFSHHSFYAKPVRTKQNFDIRLFKMAEK